MSRLAWSLARFDRLSRLDPHWQQDRLKGWVREAGRGAIMSEDWAEAYWEAVHSLLRNHQPTSDSVPPLPCEGPSISPGQVAVVMCAMCQAGHEPNQEVLSSILAFLSPRSASMTPVQDCQVCVCVQELIGPSISDRSNYCLLLQVIGALVSCSQSNTQDFVLSYVSSIESRLTRYNHACLHLLLRSLASLGYLPQRTWLLTWIECARPKLRYFGALGILNVVRSFSSWQLRPSKEFMQVIFEIMQTVMSRGSL